DPGRGDARRGRNLRLHQRPPYRRGAVSATATLPGATPVGFRLEDLPPRQIVAELDKHIVGQRAAQRAVAIALRNRWRRQQLPAEVAEEILPKNILMIGPTGVGK